jgi:serine/threonine protein kinase
VSQGAKRFPEMSSVAETQVCPTCGTPYLTKKSKGCPVCLMRGALESELDAEVDSPAEGAESSRQGRFHHYEVLRCEDGAFEELGRGAMGVTYRARDTVLGHTVALKVLDTRLAAHPQARERFLREARAAARLRHANVASVFYYGVRPTDGQCFYAMELVEGETVEARVRRTGPLPVPVSLEIITQVAHALAAAESQGVVHRDLKPANLMLVNDGPEMVVKVIDFGLAKAADVSNASDLTDGGFVGTPAFTSPEQSVGGPVDARSDLYALGVTLWMMLVGQAPFRGTPEEVRQQHQRAPLPLEHLRAVPQPVVALLKRLFEKDPSLRFQHPAELLQVLPRVMSAIDAGRTLSDRRLRQAPHGTPQKVQASPRGPKRVSVARLPVTGSDVFGREEDIAFLDDAWANQHSKVVTIVAWAGVGKSTRSTVGFEGWLLKIIVLQSWFLAGLSTDRAPLDRLRQRMNLLTPLSLGLATQIPGLERTGRRARGSRSSSRIGEPCLFWMAWSRFRIRPVHKKDGYVSLPSKRFCANSLHSIRDCA